MEFTRPRCIGGPYDGHEVEGFARDFVMLAEASGGTHGHHGGKYCYDARLNAYCWRSGPAPDGPYEIAGTTPGDVEARSSVSHADRFAEKAMPLARRPGGPAIMPGHSSAPPWRSEAIYAPHAGVWMMLGLFPTPTRD
jgi:hypothetical protein